MQRTKGGNEFNSCFQCFLDISYSTKSELRTNRYSLAFFIEII